MNNRVRTLWIALTVALTAAPACIVAARPRWQTTWNDPYHNGWVTVQVPS
jgi:hypothetical protein